MNICIIPARGGSKRIPRKNIKNFCGRPMITWSIKAALNCSSFGRVIVSTDDDEIGASGACCNHSSMGYGHWFKLSNLQWVRGRLGLPYKVAWCNNSVGFNIIFEFSPYLNQQSWCTAQPVSHKNHPNDIAWRFGFSFARNSHYHD